MVALGFGRARAEPVSNVSVSLPGDTPRTVLRAPAPVYSRDNTFVILSSAVNADYRLPVLQFAEELRRALSQTLSVSLGAPETPLTLVIADVPGETGVRCRQIQDVMGHWREQVEIGDPERVDLDDLRVALARGLLRAWLRVTAGPEHVPTAPPEWFLRGLTRAVQRPARLADIEKVLALWSHGQLPPVTELLAADPAAALREPSLSAVLVTWMSERESGGERMHRLLQHLAAGGAWSPDELLPIIQPGMSAARSDEDWDRWLGIRGRSVLEPGVTTAGMLRRFRLQLAVFPADHGAPLTEAWRARTLADLLPHADAPWMKQLTDAKAVQLRAAAMGRDSTLGAVAEAYIGFLDALARHEPVGVLQTRLYAADRLLSAAETATASGSTLHQPVSPAPRRQP